MVYMYAPAFEVQVQLVQEELPAAADLVQWNGWVIAGEGAIIGAYADAANVVFWLSGTFLQGTASVPPAAGVLPQPPLWLPPPIATPLT